MSAAYWAGVAWEDLRKQHLSTGDWRMHTSAQYALVETPDGCAQLVNMDCMTVLTRVPVHVLRAEEMHLSLLALGMREDARQFRLRMRGNNGIGQDHARLLLELLPWLGPALEQLPRDYMEWRPQLAPLADRLALSLLWLSRSCGHACPGSAAGRAYSLAAAIAVGRWAGL